MPSDRAPPTAVLSDLLSQSQMDQVSDSDDFVDEEVGETVETEIRIPGVPATFWNLPIIQDVLETESSRLELQTVQECLPGLTWVNLSQVNQHGLPKLQRDAHVEFLRHALGKKPSYFVMMDASRPWLLYWSFAGLTMLGVDVSSYRNRYGRGLPMPRNIGPNSQCLGPSLPLHLFKTRLEGLPAATDNIPIWLHRMRRL
jgi:hypothetical protein